MQLKGKKTNSFIITGLQSLQSCWKKILYFALSGDISHL